MSEVDTSMPSRAAVMSVIGRLEGLGAADGPGTSPEPAAQAVVSPPTAVVQQPPPADHAAQARNDQVAAALREMTAERDAWRVEAGSLREQVVAQLTAIRSSAEQHQTAMFALQRELEVQRATVDILRSEAEARDAQITHLGAAMTALVELANTRFDSPAAASPARPAARVADDVPRTQPPPPAVNADALAMVIPGLAPERSSPADNQRRLGVGRVKLVNQPAGQAAPQADPFQPAPQPIAAG